MHVLREIDELSGCSDAPSQSCIRYGIIRSQKVLVWYYHVYNTTTACIMYLGVLRGSNDLTATTGGSLAWNMWYKHVVTPHACLWTLYLVLHFTRGHFLCFVHLPLSIILLSVLHSNALLGGLVYVLIGLSAESANKIKLKVTASYGYDYKFQCIVSNDHRNISQHSTIGNH